MAKRKSKRIKQKTKTIQKIEETRVGGAIGMDGYLHQCLVSCYILLKFSEHDNVEIKFEGIEDIDIYRFSNELMSEHIQVKKSESKQDASFMANILKNYLEIYLNEKENENRYFTLAYDFPVSDGAFSKLISNELDEKAIDYWTTQLSKIQKNNLDWDWNGFVAENFLKQLKFEKIENHNLELDVEKLLIEKFNISSGNEKLYAISLYHYCVQKMKNRGSSSLNELQSYILEVKDLINQGATNPASKWIKEIDFSITAENDSADFYEGKKAEYTDIVAGFPIRRLKQENDIEKSLSENTITVIKSSSGQGKTTLAWQVSYNLNELYSTYQLAWCADERDISHIVDFVKSRIKIGQRPLILIDNLDVHLKAWGTLVQQLYQSIRVGYKVLATTREDDWHLYAGDQSKLRSMQLLDIKMDAEQAKQLYLELKTNKRLHSTLINTGWQHSWEKVSKQGLLIEYVYLLTHGEMLEIRLENQMKTIGGQIETSIRFELLKLLRSICFADVIGIPLAADNIGKLLNNNHTTDVNQLLKSIENEFLISYTKNKRYVTGLHPVRSRHILKLIDKFGSHDQTILDLLKVVDVSYLSKLYSYIPAYIDGNKEEFFSELIKDTSNKSYEYYVNAIQGLYSGSVLKYYRESKFVFDEINRRGALLPFLVELNPYSKLEKLSIEVTTITELLKIQPDNENLLFTSQHLKEMPAFEIPATDYYIYTYYLFSHLQKQSLRLNKLFLSKLSYWMVNINSDFGIIDESKFTQIWNDRDEWEIDEISDLMMSWYLNDGESCLKFINRNQDDIIQYIKVKTKSLLLHGHENTIHIEYLEDTSTSDGLNLQSWNRLEMAGKLLPIYNQYSAQVIKPEIAGLEFLNQYDESQKSPKKEALFLGYRKSFVELWNKTISSNYEAETAYEWLSYWFEMRKGILTFYEKTIKLFEFRLNNKQISDSFLKNLIKLVENIQSRLLHDYLFPGEDRPFEEKEDINDIIKDFKNKGKAYFTSVNNYMNQFIGLINREEKESNLAIINLRHAKIELKHTQEELEVIYKRLGYWTKECVELASKEVQILDRLLMTSLYYRENGQSRVADKWLIEKWYLNEKSERMKRIKERFEENLKEFDVAICSPFDISLPNNLRDTGTLYELPLVVRGLDIQDEMAMCLLVYLLSGLVAHGVDNTIIMFETKAGKLKNAVKINNCNLEKIDFSKTDIDEINAVNWWLPWQVEDTHLEYFDEAYEIEAEPVENKVFLEVIHRLWDYSRVIENLDDCEYRQFLLDELTERMNSLLVDLKDSDDLRKACEYYMVQVLSEDYNFSDVDLNKCYGMMM